MVPSTILAAVTAPSASLTSVMEPFGISPLDSGRGLPEPEPLGVKMNVPVFPWLSCHVPPSVERLMADSTCTGVPLGDVTMVRPMPMDPLGLRNAIPDADARPSLPH